MRTKNFIFERYALVSHLALSSVGALVLAVLLYGAANIAGRRLDEWLQYPIVTLLAIFFVLSGICTLAATFIALLNHKQLNDWRAFLVISWLIPFLGAVMALSIGRSSSQKF